VSAPRLASLFALLMLAVGLSMPAPTRAADSLIADLSKDSIEITTGFAGTDVLLFGAIEGEGDILVEVRGPASDMVVRRKDRTLGIWINRDQVGFSDVPSFYRVATSPGIFETAPNKALIQQYGIGAANLVLAPLGEVLGGRQASFRAGMIRNFEASGLYSEDIGGVDFLAPGLFSLKLHFPANVVTGTYAVQVYLLRDGLVVSKRNYSLVVRKIGIGAQVFDFAHEHPAAYGALAIAIALLAGWLAGFVFRRRA
jgi:uncharacterized protein (TIGR02186 family)